MNINELKIIAVRPLTPPDELPENRLAVYRSMLKVMNNAQHETPYYFYKGYEIQGSQILVDPILTEAVPPALYDIPYKDRVLSVNISAIVGKNGAGKSTVVELIMRLINNFATSILGEYHNNPGSEHLHYIEDVYGELYYFKKGYFYQLKVYGRSISIRRYSKMTETNKKEIKRLIYRPFKEIYSWKNEDSPALPLKKNEDHLRQLADIFYTIIINHSHYAYNTYDYYQEYSDKKKIETIHKKLLEEQAKTEPEDKKKKKEKKEKKEEDDENNSWLKGIFHKNDTYQTPIVLNPFRRKGNVDINTEIHLSKSRLAALFLKGKEDAQFRKINEKQTAYSFEIKENPLNYPPKDGSTYSVRLDEIKKKLGKNFYNIYRYIIEAWSKVHGIDLNKLDTYDDRTKKFALDYIAYKTLRITERYRMYAGYLADLVSPETSNRKQVIKELVIDLYKDNTHVTLKLRQTFSFLFFNEPGFHFNTGTVTIDQYQKDVEKCILKQELFLHRLRQRFKMDRIIDEEYLREEIDFVPSPIFTYEIHLIDSQKKENQELKTENPCTFHFSSLSSGEKQLTYSIASLLYHLTNINSVKEKEEEKIVSYHHLYIILEEIELYFHPDLQRRYVITILEGLKQISLPNIQGIQFCFVTHSPFVLSDIPHQNILFLDMNGPIPQTTAIKTFGANIHDILKESFFLCEGAMGELTRRKINMTIEVLNYLLLNEKWRRQELSEDDITIFFNKKDSLWKNYPEIRKLIEDENSDELLNMSKAIIDLVDEPILNRKLLEMYYELIVVPVKDKIDKEISLLQMKIKDLEKKKKEE